MAWSCLRAHPCPAEGLASCGSFQDSLWSGPTSNRPWDSNPSAPGHGGGRSWAGLCPHTLHLLGASLASPPSFLSTPRAVTSSPVLLQWPAPRHASSSPRGWACHPVTSASPLPTLSRGADTSGHLLLPSPRGKFSPCSSDSLGHMTRSLGRHSFRAGLSLSPPAPLPAGSDTLTLHVVSGSASKPRWCPALGAVTRP